MKVSIRAISDSRSLSEIEDEWNCMIDKHSESPNLLSGFVKQFIDSDSPRGWFPILLLITVNDRIVGASPFKIKTKLGFRIAKFLPKLRFSQDLVAEDQYRDLCMAHTVDFLFKTLRCQVVDFLLPLESPNLRILKEKCQARGIRLDTRPQMGHSLLLVEHTWNEFEAFRGGNFRRKFKKIERNLTRFGSWRITSREKGNEESEVIKKILDVESTSWKEEERTQSGMEIDQDLQVIWNGALRTTQTVSDFNWKIWFLEAGEKTLAYAMIFIYKETAFIVKTSYDERYKRFYPGIFVINEAIRELFNERQVKRIDFLTDLPFMKTWTSLSLPRVGVVMSKRSILQPLIRFAYADENTRNVSKLILALISRRMKFLADFLG